MGWNADCGSAHLQYYLLTVSLLWLPFTCYWMSLLTTNDRYQAKTYWEQPWAFSHLVFFLVLMLTEIGLIAFGIYYLRIFDKCVSCERRLFLFGNTQICKEDDMSVHLRRMTLAHVIMLSITTAYALFLGSHSQKVGRGRFAGESEGAGRRKMKRIEMRENRESDSLSCSLVGARKAGTATS